ADAGVDGGDRDPAILRGDAGPDVDRLSADGACRRQVPGGRIAIGGAVDGDDEIAERPAGELGAAGLELGLDAERADGAGGGGGEGRPPAGIGEKLSEVRQRAGKTGLEG